MSNSKPASREELIEWCLRRLGKPVLEVNIDEEQEEDLLEEALQFWREFHFDASIQTFLKIKLEASKMFIQSGNGLNFQKNDIIIGATSNARCVVHELIDNDSFFVKNVTGVFESNELIQSDKSNISATLESSIPVILGNWDNKYFEMPESILSVVKVLPMNRRIAGSYMFDVRYQLFLNNMPSLTSLDLGYYASLKTYLNLLNDTLVPTPGVRYSRHKDRLYLDIDWERDLRIGEFVVFEAHQYIEEDHTKIFNDYFLKRYLTALFKKQWGTNLKKFEGVQMPGGVVLNGQRIYDESIEELRILHDEIKNTYQYPIDFFVG